MKIVIQGSKTFNDYNVFLRAIMVAMSPLKDEDTRADIYSVGPAKLNSLATGFVNMTEDSMKARVLPCGCTGFLLPMSMNILMSLITLHICHTLTSLCLG